MTDFLSGWAQNPPSRPNSFHSRSQSTVPRTVGSPFQAPATRVSRATSASSLHKMAAVARAPGHPTLSPSRLSAYNDDDDSLSTIPDPRSRAMNPARTPGHPTLSPSRLSTYNDDDDNLSTIPDPRSRTMTPSNGTGPPSPSQHPDLNDEVATLSNKLINAINHQTNLDDTLSATRHELETSREQIRQLEYENEEFSNQLAQGILVSSDVVQVEKQKIMASMAHERELREEAEKEKRKTIASMAHERELREEAEKEKKKMELELENLTAALFEEANKMVVTAREEAKKEQDIIQRKNDQLKAQIEDTESLLRSHQEQLAELKLVMEQMNAERDDQTNPTAPSTPGLSKFDSKDDTRDTVDSTSSAASDTTPSNPLSFTHLIMPVLRTDLASYDDFNSLLQTSKSNSVNRVSSGSYGGIGLGLAFGSGSHFSTQTPSNGSTASLALSNGSTPATPTTPASTMSNASNNGPPPIALKETKFYKRALAEDVEPTLRLDTAPGLSWLARRTVLNSMCEGTLVIEPIPHTNNTKLFMFACSLCGETRKDAEHIRTHRFRTSENESAQRYPLCKYCHGRVLSSCNFLVFLRMVKDGHLRADNQEKAKAAWEECVRLREQMFWCRMGGGVIPAVQRHTSTFQVQKSPRISESDQEIAKVMDTLEEELERTGEIRPRDVTPTPAIDKMKPRGVRHTSEVNRPAVREFKADVEGNATFLERRREEKLRLNAKTVEAASARWQAAQDDAAAPSPIVSTHEEEVEEKTKVKEDKFEETNLEVPSPEPSSSGFNAIDEKRLSLTIPGAFEQS